MNFNSSQSNGLPKINYRDLIIFVLPVLIFVLYLFAYNPGVLTVDSFSQLHQIATGKFTTAHPIFHTFLEMLCLKIFKSPFYIGLFQILIFSAIWMGICKYHRDDYSKNSNAFIVQFIVTLIVCLIPINAIYSITLSSNVLFSYSIMLLCFLIKIMVDKNGQVGKKLIILMALTLGIMSGLNNYGILIAVPILIAITYYILKKGNAENTTVMFVGLAILCIFLIASLNFVYDVQKDTLNIHTNDAFEEKIDINNAQSQFFSKINGEPKEDYESITSGGNNKYNLVYSIVDLFKENFILDGLFNNPILYLIVSVILLALINFINPSKEIFFIYMPPLLSVIITILTGQNNAYYNLLVFYLILIILTSVLFKVDLKTNNVNNTTPTIAKEERIETPAINETTENQFKEDYYTSLETEIDNLTLDDINEMLNETEVTDKTDITDETNVLEKKQVQKTQKPESTSSDLIDEILKEIEMEKK